MFYVTLWLIIYTNEYIKPPEYTLYPLVISDENVGNLKELLREFHINTEPLIFYINSEKEYVYMSYACKSNFVKVDQRE